LTALSIGHAIETIGAEERKRKKNPARGIYEEGVNELGIVGGGHPLARKIFVTQQRKSTIF
jgi:hypothetical protein